ncbi:unnamed protein product [Kuraishia capsulata CBS 1993]|uniref:Uncharacterized protein n=1 Tax=Kuraishia capsulata CBS 1993 TaxID=1382522 RepID=W6ML12_9ASCO|nr:uncharacterized protein KUCA_T00002747001 [Kuraishia capsulata CBS 1993]CDK26773.1 unnamed protein product [Kuraishia capsulata CBS 1993]
MQGTERSDTSSLSEGTASTSTSEMHTPPPSPRLSYSNQLPLSPPRHILSRLTPVGRKADPPTVSLDLSTHSLRRKKIIQEKVQRISQYSKEVDEKASKAQALKNELRQNARRRFGEKMNRALEKRNQIIDRKRNLASKLQRRSSLHSNLTGVEEIVSQNTDQCEEDDHSEADSFDDHIFDGFNEKIIRRALYNYKSAALFKRLRRTHIFGRSLDLSIGVGYQKASELIQIKWVIEALSFILGPSFGLVDDRLEKHYSKIFLYSYLMLCENKENGSNGGLSSSTDTSLPTNERDFASYLEGLSSTEAKLYTNTSLYRIILKMAFQNSEDALKRFRSLLFAPLNVSLNSKSAERISFSLSWLKFTHCFDSYLLLHRQRSRILLLSVVNVLQREINFLKFSSEEGMQTNDEYEKAICSFEVKVTQTKRTIAMLDAENKKLNHQKAILMEFKRSIVISDDNPLLYSSLSNPVSSLAEVAGGKLTSLVDDPSNALKVSSWSAYMSPPGLSMTKWRQYLMRIILQAKGPGPNNFIMRSGRNQYSQEKNHDESVDIDVVRSLCGLKSYKEACSEVLRHLEYLDEVEEMMETVFDLTKQLILSLGVVIEVEDGDTSKLLVDYSYRQYRSSILRLCKTKELKNDFYSGALNINDYFALVSKFVLEEASFNGNCFDELMVFLKQGDTKSKAFYQEYVRLVTECVIYGINHWCSSFFKMIKMDLIKFETNCFVQEFPSTDLTKPRFNLLHSFISTNYVPANDLLKRTGLLQEGDELKNTGIDVFLAGFIELVTSDMTLKENMNSLPETFALLTPEIRSLCVKYKAFLYTNLVCMLVMQYFQNCEFKLESYAQYCVSPRMNSLQALFDQSLLISQIHHYFEKSFESENYAGLPESKQEILNIIRRNARDRLGGTWGQLFPELRFEKDIEFSIHEIVEKNVDKDIIQGLINKIEAPPSMQRKSLKGILAEGVKAFLISKKVDYPQNAEGLEYTDIQKLKQLTRSSLRLFLQDHPTLRAALEAISEEAYSIFNCSFTVYGKYYSTTLDSYITELV